MSICVTVITLNWTYVALWYSPPTKLTYDIQKVVFFMLVKLLIIQILPQYVCTGIIQISLQYFFVFKVKYWFSCKYSCKGCNYSKMIYIISVFNCKKPLVLKWFKYKIIGVFTSLVFILSFVVRYNFNANFIPNFISDKSEEF